MQRIRAKDTGPEMLVRKYLHARGFRYSLHRAALPGRPDIVLRRYRTIVQVQGCFWHQHPDPSCRAARVPHSNGQYWIPKLRRTVERDARNLRVLADMGWAVEVVWECRTDPSSLAQLAERIAARGPATLRPAAGRLPSALLEHGEP